MTLLRLLAFAFLVLSTAQANPSTHDLAFDVYLAREEVVYFRQQSVTYSGALVTFQGRFDTTVPALADTIISKLQGLNVDIQEITAIQNLFNSGFQTVTDAVKNIESTLQNTTVTSGGVLTSLDTSDWVALREQNSALTLELNYIDNQFQSAKAQWIVVEVDQESNLYLALQGQDAGTVANVMVDWEDIKSFFKSDGIVLENENQIFTVRGGKTLDSLRIVLEQVL
ncbi:uncharacterized protein LOC132200672 [Neocloeon triangulifer]|uniref:uncharacterized protein LOC132200672 n=1 Tax=Neocloeon triangulifer TaxID=2078957 RepID=UPI00286FACBA|nr:uncharacterized protein LOC132200672 [Neocloeon triangulifer]